MILFAVDASGSMAARKRMAAAKQAVLSLLLDAYQKRDRVGLIAFRGSQAELLLPPTTSVDLAERRLQSLPTGGRTPLGHALQVGMLAFERHRANHPEDVPLLLVVSDGRANVPVGSGDPASRAAGAGRRDPSARHRVGRRGHRERLDAGRALPAAQRGARRRSTCRWSSFGPASCCARRDIGLGRA